MIYTKRPPERMDILRTFWKVSPRPLTKINVIHYDLENALRNYLKEIGQEKLIDLASKINHREILSLYTQAAENLWDKFTLPKVDKEYQGAKWTFINSAWDTIIYRVLFMTFRMLKNDSQNKTIEELNKNMISVFQTYFHLAFESYELQFTLNSLHPDNNSHLIIEKLEELKHNAEIGSKFAGKKHRAFEAPVFEKIIRKLNEYKKQNLDVSARTVAKQIAETDLNLIHYEEQEKFYERFLRYRKKKMK